MMMRQVMTVREVLEAVAHEADILEHSPDSAGFLALLERRLLPLLLAGQAMRDSHPGDVKLRGFRIQAEAKWDAALAAAKETG